MKTNDKKLTRAQEHFKREMALSKMNNQSFDSVVNDDLSRNREEMDKALKFGVSKEDFDAWVGEFHKKHPKSGLYVENGQNIFYKDGEPFAVLGDDAAENLDASLKEFFRREAIPLNGDEQKEI